MKIKRALISVYDKTGLDYLARELVVMGVEIISTGGTRKFIEDLGLKVKDIEDFTGFPEILDGRVKTINPKVHGAILAKRNSSAHLTQIIEHNIELIDMVVVNLYPFIDLMKKKNILHNQMIENIDIGGPSLLRAAAKSYEYVIPICDTSDYKRVIETLKSNGDISLEERGNLAAKVFVTTSIYDNFIHNYLSETIVKKETMPDEINKNLKKVFNIRYGENPHQKAAFYKSIDSSNDTIWKQFSGKELSYNNLLDIESGLNIVNDIQNKAIAIIKHNNPSGVGKGSTIFKAYQNALAGDPVSAFGGIVASNSNIDKNTAIEINKIFTECVVSPSYDEDALEVLKSKKNIRILEISKKYEKEYDYKAVFDGFLIQEKDNIISINNDFVTKKIATQNEIKDLEFAWIVCKHVKSNAIVIAKDDMIIGIGAGQMSRIDSIELAILKAKKLGFNLNGSVLASDAYFPFKDSIEMISNYGISAVVQPGGSIRDNEVIEACNNLNIAMIFTGERHFKH